MTVSDELKDLEKRAADLQQALIDAHEWQALTHLQNAMHELWQAQTCTAAYQVEVAKALFAGTEEGTR
jgi:hypothetical protein